MMIKSNYFTQEKKITNHCIKSFDLKCKMYKKQSSDLLSSWSINGTGFGGGARDVLRLPPAIVVCFAGSLSIQYRIL